MILQKFLRANANDLSGAKTQLTNALKWRKSYQPVKAMDEVFNSTKFGGLGFVTTIKGAKETKNDVDVATFNIYGAVGKDTKTTFGDTDAFVRWRVALMVSSISQFAQPYILIPVTTMHRKSRLPNSSSTKPTSPYQTTYKAVTHIRCVDGVKS